LSRAHVSLCYLIDLEFPSSWRVYVFVCVCVYNLQLELIQRLRNGAFPNKSSNGDMRQEVWAGVLFLQGSAPHRSYGKLMFTAKPRSCRSGMVNKSRTKASFCPVEMASVQVSHAWFRASHIFFTGKQNWCCVSFAHSEPTQRWMHRNLCVKLLVYFPNKL
jgi:hypothetical protein